MCLYVRDKAKSISEIQAPLWNYFPRFKLKSLYWAVFLLFWSVGNLELYIRSPQTIYFPAVISR
jgi:hypothetical protein